jgi:CubicO group peptidase (beta-lactamase class C family)
MIRYPFVILLLATLLNACSAPALPEATTPTEATPGVVLPLRGTPAALPPSPEIAEWTDNFLATLSNDSVFSGYVLIARGDEVLYSNGHGFSDREAKTPHSATMRYRIGSITKQFTAASILRLESEGKLRVEDSACTHLPSCPEGWDSITIHQLLTHTAGLANYTELPGYRQQQATTTTPDELIARFAEQPLVVIPDGDYAYSNSNYTVLGRIIEHVSGQPYGDFLKERFFDPLGMADTAYDLNPAGLAVGYATIAARALPIDTSVGYASGGLSSTAEDLLRWNRALYSGKVVSAAQLTKMTTPYSGAGQWRPGYGLFIGEVAGHRDIGHGGGIDGFLTTLDYLIDDDVTIIVLMNQENGNTGIIADSIIGFLVGANETN